MTLSRRIETSLVRDHGTLEEAVAALLARFAKALHAAEHCRVGPKNLCAYANPNLPGRQMPIDVVRDLENAAGDPVVTRCLAAHQAYVLFPLRAARAGRPWERHQQKVVKEGSEVFTKLTEMLEDERMSRGEAADLLTEVEEALSAFAALRAALKRKVSRTRA